MNCLVNFVSFKFLHLSIRHVTSSVRKLNLYSGKSVPFVHMNRFIIILKQLQHSYSKLFKSLGDFAFLRKQCNTISLLVLTSSVVLQDFWFLMQPAYLLRAGCHSLFGNANSGLRSVVVHYIPYPAYCNRWKRR